MFDLVLDCENIVANIKRASWFPYKTGMLKFHATKGILKNPNLYEIHFSSMIAPYVQYLEEGTKPHDIPGAFGNPPPFGCGGRFNGKFHPGSTKHKGFISEKCVNEVINYFVVKYKGMVDVIK